MTPTYEAKARFHGLLLKFNFVHLRRGASYDLGVTLFAKDADLQRWGAAR
jgi:hypothetical protein